RILIKRFYSCVKRVTITPANQLSRLCNRRWTMVRRTLGALVLTLAMGSCSLGVTLFKADFDDNSNGTAPAGWIFNTPGGSDAGPKAQTAVQHGVVEVTGKSSSGTFVQLTPGADGTFNSYQPQSNNKLILTVDIAG